MIDLTRDSQSVKPRLLFVDDEASIRMTLPAILQQQGFEVLVAASVPEALQLMNREKFDMLLTDLNIGAPADGFILVSAMRKIQPGAATFILTGYPDFQTALEAIRKQVDDYFTKPADIPTLISTLKEKAHCPRGPVQAPCKRMAEMILENSDAIIQRWLQQLAADPRLTAIRISDEQRIDRYPLLLNDLANALASNQPHISAESLSTAAVHGEDRARQGYTIPLLVAESRILNRVIAAVLQENLLSMDLSALIADALRMGEYLQAFLEESIRVFEGKMSRALPSSSILRKVRAKVV